MAVVYPRETELGDNLAPLDVPPLGILTLEDLIEELRVAFSWRCGSQASPKPCPEPQSLKTKSSILFRHAAPNPVFQSHSPKTHSTGPRVSGVP